MLVVSFGLVEVKAEIAAWRSLSLCPDPTQPKGAEVGEPGPVLGSETLVASMATGTLSESTNEMS